MLYNYNIYIVWSNASQVWECENSHVCQFHFTIKTIISRITIKWFYLYSPFKIFPIRTYNNILPHHNFIAHTDSIFSVSSFMTIS